MGIVGRRKSYRIYNRDEWKCVYCEREVSLRPSSWEAEFIPLHLGTRASIDHLMPRSMGGTNDEENLVTACVRCNTERGTMPVAEYLAYRRELGPSSKASLSKSFRGQRLRASKATVTRD